MIFACWRDVVPLAGSKRDPWPEEQEFQNDCPWRPVGEIHRPAGSAGGCEPEGPRLRKSASRTKASMNGSASPVVFASAAVMTIVNSGKLINYSGGNHVVVLPGSLALVPVGRVSSTTGRH